MATIVGSIALGVTGQAAARVRHHRHQLAATPTVDVPPQPAFSFYPETIEGGSRGNLPFNNQIRKLRDPLNANGGGG